MAPPPPGSHIFPPLWESNPVFREAVPAAGLGRFLLLLRQKRSQRRIHAAAPALAGRGGGLRTRDPPAAGWRETFGVAFGGFVIGRRFLQAGWERETLKEESVTVEVKKRLSHPTRFKGSQSKQRDSNQRRDFSC